eukprot:2564616-Pyramimonas_sp.AAC.1
MRDVLTPTLMRSAGDSPVDKIDISASIMTVNSHLDVLRPAIKSYGGDIDVVKVPYPPKTSRLETTT